MSLNPLESDGLITGIIARVSVQFQSVVERFAPHDAIISIANPTDLREAALSSACSLHTASASVRSSNGSLRGRGLAEIAEVVGEQQQDSKATREPRSEANGELPKGNRSPSQTSAANGNRESTLPREAQIRTISPTEDLNTDKALPATPIPANPDASGSSSNKPVYDAIPSVDRPGINRLSVDRPSMDRPSMDNPSMDRPGIDRFNTGRASIDRGQTSRSTRSSALAVQDTYKAKVKLGPRPSIDYSGRQRTSGSYSRPTEPRPVASLPSGVRVPACKPSSAKPQSQQSSVAVNRCDVPKVSPPSSPVQATPVYPSDRSYQSPGNANEHLRHAFTSTSKAPILTPEKKRLMKALQLRKQQIAHQEENEKLRMQSNLQSSDCGTVHTQPSDAQDIRLNSHDVVTIESRNNAMDPVVDEPVSANINVLAASLTHSPEGHSMAVASSMLEQETGAEVDRHDAPELTETPPHDSELSVEDMENISSSSVQPLTRHESIDKRADQHFPSATPDSGRLHNPSPQEVPLPLMTEHEKSSLRPQRVVLKETQERVHVPPDLDSNTLHAESSSEATSKAQSGRDAAKARPSTEEFIDLCPVERPAWRRGLVDPIRIVSSADDSDDLNFLSDDSFMEELKSATVQEAKPISVSKTPITPLFPRRPSDQRSNGVSVVSRAVSSPIGDINAQNRQHLLPELSVRGSMRSVSASPSPEIRSQQASAPMAKKVNVSSGISQRIKALEMFTSRENSPTAQSFSSATSPKGSVSSPRNTSLTTSPHKYDSFKSSGPEKRVDSPRMSPSASPKKVTPDHKRRLNGTSATAKKSTPRPESVSVTATIVRDARNERSPVLVDPSEPAAMDLLQSPLVVEHQAREWAQEQSQGRTSKQDRPSSIHSSSIESRRNSVTSGHSISSRKDGRMDAPRSMSDTSSNGLASPDEQQEEKTRSRKSRLFKRMSWSFSSAARQSIVQALSPTVKEEPIIEHHEPVAPVLPNIVDVGDINVQFPDTLVWNLMSIA